MIFKTPFPNFNKKIDVVACFIQCSREVLVLYRNDGFDREDTWGSVAGKVEEGEERINAVVREIKEEVGLTVSKEDCKMFDSFFVRYPESDFLTLFMV